MTIEHKSLQLLMENQAAILKFIGGMPDANKDVVYEQIGKLHDMFYKLSGIDCEEWEHIG